MWGIVINNEDYFKRFFFSNVYIVNFDIGLVTLIDTRPLGLTIMLDPRKYGSGERAKSKILGFDNQSNSRQTWIWKWCQARNTWMQGLWCFMAVLDPR